MLKELGQSLQEHWYCVLCFTAAHTSLEGKRITVSGNQIVIDHEYMCMNCGECWQQTITADIGYVHSNVVIFPDVTYQDEDEDD